MRLQHSAPKVSNRGWNLPRPADLGTQGAPIDAVVKLLSTWKGSLIMMACLLFSCRWQRLLLFWRFQLAACAIAVRYYLDERALVEAPCSAVREAIRLTRVGIPVHRIRFPRPTGTFI
jgi:hypothetical protein